MRVLVNKDFRTEKEKAASDWAFILSTASIFVLLFSKKLSYSEETFVFVVWLLISVFIVGFNFGKTSKIKYDGDVQIRAVRSRR